MDGLVHIQNDAERFIFEKVRCTCNCGRPLTSCSCGEAEAAREHIRERMEAHATADQIVAEYAAEHGTDLLVVPPNRGALRSIYAVPVVGIALGAFWLARMLRRWRKGDGPADARGEPERGTKEPRDAYDARLDDELKDLDG